MNRRVPATAVLIRQPVIRVMDKRCGHTRARTRGLFESKHQPDGIRATVLVEYKCEEVCRNEANDQVRKCLVKSSSLAASQVRAEAQIRRKEILCDQPIGPVPRGPGNFWLRGQTYQTT